MLAKPIARRYLVSGLVQGVGFRFFALRIAERLGVSGYVLNRRDGRVEVYVIGDASRQRDMLIELRRGPRGAEVSEVVEQEAEVLEEHSGSFTIEHDNW